MKKFEIFAIIFVITLSAFYLFFKNGGLVTEAATTKNHEDYKKIVQESRGKDLDQLSGQEIKAFEIYMSLNIQETKKHKDEEAKLRETNGQKTGQELYLKSGLPYVEVGRGTITTLPHEEVYEVHISKFGWLATANMDGKDFLVEATPGDNMKVGDDVIFYEMKIPELENSSRWCIVPL